MKLELDPEKIKRISKEKEGENWSFRSFLKTCEIHDKTVDRTVKKFNQKVKSKVDCRQCANCCLESVPIVSESDIPKIAAKLKISNEQFKQDYLVEDEDGEGYRFNREPCPFLDGKKCSIYSIRPKGCGSYPPIPENGFKKRLVFIIQHCSVCPIVFNVFEYLKKEIWALDDTIEDFEEGIEDEIFGDLLGDPLDDIIDDLDLDEVDDW